jgi:sugar phosphate isomerase/epimerase
MFDSKQPSTSLTRRGLLRGAAAAGAAAALTGFSPELQAGEEKAAMNGRIKQSIVFWCFNGFGDKWDMDTACQIAKELGCVSVELAGADQWGPLKKHGLICAIAGNGMPGAPFKKGFNNPKYQDEVIERTKTAIDACAEAGCPSVIAFSGYKWRDAEDPTSGEIPRDEGFDNCVTGFKKIVGYAEKKGVTICMEHLNSRDHSHPMKGHPGYQGDDVDWMASIIRKVGSPRLKLLFDIYHVQIMHGDLLRRIEENKDIIGHVHTAGNPGRGELDETQEIQYAPLMKKLLEIKYEGYVGQEFIPTRDARTGLRQAVKLCDV